MKASMALQLLPQRMQSEQEALRVIDAIIKDIKSQYPTAHVGPFETTVEADLDACLELIGRILELARSLGADQNACNIKLWTSANANLLSTQEKIAPYEQR